MQDELRTQVPRKSNRNDPVCRCLGEREVIELCAPPNQIYESNECAQWNERNCHTLSTRNTHF